MDSYSYEIVKAIYMLVRAVKINGQQVSENKRFTNRCEEESAYVSSFRKMKKEYLVNNK